jgi:GAF domain-containing protein
MKFDKNKAYQTAVGQIDAVLEGETNMVLKMATVNCILKEHLPYYYWVGFYCVHQDALIVGPYQGTLGCLHIPYDRGICGRAARTQTVQLIEDVHQDPAHIACDAATNSEIVLPVWDNEGQLIAVFDVDSTHKKSFDTTDKTYLQALLLRHFKQQKLEKEYR